MAELDCNKSQCFVSCAVISPLFFTSDILKKFNPNIKGMSKGQGKRQTGFNVAVSGAKISWALTFLWSVFQLHFHAFCAIFKAFCALTLWKPLMSHRGIPGQVRRLIDTMKSDSVSLTRGTTLMHAPTSFCDHHKNNPSSLPVWFFLHPFWRK